MPSPAGEGLGRGAFGGVGVLGGHGCRARTCQPLILRRSPWRPGSGGVRSLVPETTVWPRPDHGSSQVKGRAEQGGLGQGSHWPGSLGLRDPYPIVRFSRWLRRGFWILAAGAQDSVPGPLCRRPLLPFPLTRGGHTAHAQHRVSLPAKNSTPPARSSTRSPYPPKNKKWEVVGFLPEEYGACS